MRTRLPSIARRWSDVEMPRKKVLKETSSKKVKDLNNVQALKSQEIGVYYNADDDILTWLDGIMIGTKYKIRHYYSFPLLFLRSSTHSSTIPLC